MERTSKQQPICPHKQQATRTLIQFSLSAVCFGIVAGIFATISFSPCSVGNLNYAGCPAKCLNQ